MRHFQPFPLGHYQVDWRKLGDMVNRVRWENGMTLREFADLTGISASTLCRCEKGLSVEPDHFFTLLQVIGLPFSLPEGVMVATDRER